MTGYDPTRRPDGTPDSPATPDPAPASSPDAAAPPPPHPSPAAGTPPATGDESPTVAWARPPGGTVEDATPPPDGERVEVERRGNRLRWGVALIVTVLVVGIVAAAVLLVTGQSEPSTVAGYAPAGSVAYGELRLDLPGDQRQQLGEFLSKFPGFADQSTLETKIDDVLDRLVVAASEQRQDWSTDIKPWFGGQLGFALAELPAIGDGQTETPRALVILRVTDAAKARAWFDELVADEPRTETNHQNVALTVFGDGQDAGAMAIHADRMMLVGDEASVRAAIDTGGEGTFGDEGAFAEAVASVEGEGLGFVYVDARQYMAWIQEVGGSMPGGSGFPSYAVPAESLPEWMLLRARAAGDALAFEIVVPHTEATAVATENRAGIIAGLVPPTTFVLAEGHEFGASVLKGIELARRDPEVADQLRELEQQLALIGGLDGIIGWWGDSGLAIARDGDGVHGGIVIQPRDRADAERLIGVIRAGLMLGGAGTGVTVREEEHAGVTITVIDLGDIGSIAPLLLMGSPLPPGTDLPEGRIEIAMAATDDVVVVAAGPAFVQAVLDAADGDSLADDARYQALIDRVGAENIGSTFVDFVAVRELVEQLAQADPAAFAEYERDVRPYLLPLDALVQATRLDGEHDRTLSLITVK